MSDTFVRVVLCGLVLGITVPSSTVHAQPEQDAGVSAQTLAEDEDDEAERAIVDAGTEDGSTDAGAAVLGGDAGKYTPAEQGPSGDRCHALMHDGTVSASDCWAYCTAHAARLACLRDVGQRSSSDGGAIADDSQALALWRYDGWMAVGVSLALMYLFWRISQLDNTGRTTFRGLLVWFARLRRSPTEPTSGSATPASVAVEAEGRESDPYLVRAFQTVAFIPALLLTTAHLYGISSYLLGYSYLADFARPSLVVVGMMSLGVLFGGLFGLPTRRRPAEDPAGEATAGNGRRARVDFGDRLEDVADWLTKLILGASLTQIQTIWDNGDRINEFFSRATGMRQDYPLGTVLAVAALGGGFLLGYASTLLFLPVALHAGMQELDTIKHRATASKGDPKGHGIAPKGPSGTTGAE